MTEYAENFMQTFTGVHFHYLTPVVEEINIEDIAHHLSLICRFTGACAEFYSVAEHSVRVSYLVPGELKLAALLHDAHEAYTGDLNRPIKTYYKLWGFGDSIQKVINKKYGVNSYTPEIKKADDRLLATEARDLMTSTDGWETLPAPLSTKIIPWDSWYAKTLFLTAFSFYGGLDE